MTKYMENRVNHWASVGNKMPYVAASDLEAVSNFNSLNIAEQFKFRLDVLPEPYIGDPNAPIYLLNLNPGFSEDDVVWHQNELFGEIIRKNLTHSNIEYPFYPLNPNFKKAPVSGWWLQKLKNLITSTNLECVAHSVFCVEYHGYHSVKYKAISRRITSGHLPSQLYSQSLVTDAMLKDKYIILMRSKKEWLSLVPDLESYKNYCEIRSPQNPQLSPKNLINYEKIIEEIRSQN